MKDMVGREWWLLELEEMPAGMLLGWNGHGGTTISLLSTEFNRPAGGGMNIILLFRSFVPHDSLTNPPTYQHSVTNPKAHPRNRILMSVAADQKFAEGFKFTLSRTRVVLATYCC